MKPQTILLDSTESLVMYPRGGEGRGFLGVASAATVRVQTPSTAIPDSGDAASVDSVSSSTNAAANEGDTSLSFAADPTATKGRQYLLTTPEGDELIVTCKKSGTTFYLTEPLAMDVGSGATLEGLAITHALTTDETSQTGLGLARVTATIGGVDYTWDHTFRIVAVGYGYTLTPEALFTRYDIARNLLPPHDETGSETIESAWTDLLEPYLAQDGIHSHRIKGWEALEPVHALACVAWLTRNNQATPREEASGWMQDFQDLYATVISSRDNWVVSEDTGTEAPPDDGDPLYGWQPKLVV